MPLLDLNLIVRDPEIQPREAMNQNVITQYAEDMAAGIAFPPVVVFFDGDRRWLAEGFHRSEAAELAGLGEIEADVRHGSRDEALWFACQANKEHDKVGLRRTNKDKGRSVKMALRHPNAAIMSNVEIAEHCGVDPQTVANHKASIFRISEDSPTRTVTREVNGKPQSYTMRVGKIGHSSGNPADLPPRPGPEWYLTKDGRNWYRPATTRPVESVPYTQEVRGERASSVDLDETPPESLAGDDTDSGEYFRCVDCDDIFHDRVWHCRFCNHHWPDHDDECRNCHRDRALKGSPLAEPIESKIANLIITSGGPAAFGTLLDDPEQLRQMADGIEEPEDDEDSGDDDETGASDDDLFVLDATPEPPKVSSPKTFNRTNEMVEWALWTWNPVTGCEHNCVYCYARDIANRFYPEKFEPTFRPERLDAPSHTSFPSQLIENLEGLRDDALAKGNLPLSLEIGAKVLGNKNVFVCSMADLFGRWVPEDWITSVFDSCRKSPEWNYLFLTKFPLRYESLDFPETAWVGTSVDEQKRVANAEKAFAKVEAPIKWLSCEPLREPLKFSRLDLFDWVVIGGQSRSSGAPEFLPPFEWVADLVVQAKQAGCKVYIKPNIGFDGPTRPREYPGCE